MVFFRYKLRKFQDEHPDWPTPTQIVLWSHTWGIPGPDQRPWDWMEESNERIVRWRPRRFPKATGESLEIYLLGEGRFENKAPHSWKPRMPGSSD